MKQKEPPVKIIRIPNKKTGTIYLYEDTPYWDSKLKQGRHKRKCIGKLDANGNALYNDYYLNRKVLDDAKNKEWIVSSTTLMGENLILDKVIEASSLTDPLAKAFGKEEADLLLQLVRYLVCEDKGLEYAQDWLDSRGFSPSKLTSPAIMHMLNSLSEEKQNVFYGEWIANNAEQQSLLFEISSTLPQTQEDPCLWHGQDQRHIALLCTYKTNVPLWCTELPGGISELNIRTLLLDRLKEKGVGKVCFLLEESHYSDETIEDLGEKQQSFTIPVPLSEKRYHPLIEEHLKDLQRPANLIPQEDQEAIIYALTVEQMSKYGRMWVHLFYEPLKKQHDIARLMKILQKCQNDLEEGRMFKSRAPFYDRYFETEQTPLKRVTLKEDALDAFIKGHCGCSVLLSSVETDAGTALGLHRHLSDLELCMPRGRRDTSDMEGGRLFLHVLTLIVENELQQLARSVAAEVGEHWDYRMILQKVSSYTRIEHAGRSQDAYSEPTRAQRVIFDLCDIDYEGKVSGKGEKLSLDEEDRV